LFGQGTTQPVYFSQVVKASHEKDESESQLMSKRGDQTLDLDNPYTEVALQGSRKDELVILEKVAGLSPADVNDGCSRTKLGNRTSRL
jgi:hypothetical protein